MTRCIFFLWVSGLTAAWLTAVPAGALRADDDQSPDPPAGKLVHALFFDQAQPILMAFRIQVDGQPLESGWIASVRKSFEYLDVDENDKLSMDELSRARWYTESSPIRQTGGVLRNLFKRLSSSPDPPKTTGVTSGLALEQFTDRYRETMPDFKVLATSAPPTVGIQLWNRLDTDSDQRISFDELQQLASEIQRLDVNDDELLSIVELMQFQNPFAGFNGAPRGGSSNQSELVLLDVNNPASEIISRLVETYGRETEQRTRAVPLSRLGLSADDRSRLDTNGDGHLEYAELREMLTSATIPVAFEVQIRKVSAEQKQGSEITTLRNDAPQLEVQSSSAGTMLVNSDTSQIEIEFGQSAQFDYTATYTQQFGAADQDNNQYLEKKEVESSPYFRNSFSEIDRNADGKIFEEELTSFLEQRQTEGASRVEATITNYGTQLFQLFDSDGDGRLSPREVNQSSARATAWDRNGDGLLEQDEVPRSYRISFGRGSVSQIGDIFFAANAQTVQVRIRTSEGLGPEWFRKLDRNRDGDVSRREFVGPTELFNKMDDDANGLIDAQEAAAIEK